MNFEKRTAISLSEIKKQIEHGNLSEGLESIDKLWQVMGRLGKNKEAITVGEGLHGTEVIKKAHEENRIILGSHLDLHEIILAK